MIWSRREFVRVMGAGAAVARAGAAQQQPDGQRGFVKTRGKDIIGPDGEKLHLRGINLGNWFEPEGYMFLFDKGPQSPREIEGFFKRAHRSFSGE